MSVKYLSSLSKHSSIAILVQCSATEGRFGMRFAMAIALLDRKFGLAQATDAKVNSRVVKSLMKRITSYVHPIWVAGRDTPYNHADVVKVRLKNKKERSHKVLTAKGDLKTRRP